MSEDLASRVLAAIAEVEETARACTPGPWRWVRERDHAMLLVGPATWVAEFGGYDVVLPVADGERYPSKGNAAHVARQNPDAVLRRCAADRKIVERHGPEGSGKYGHYCGECGGTDYPVSWPCPTLQSLAEGYGIA